MRIFGAITWFLGIGGLMYAACNAVGVSGPATGPDWMYSRF
ncbi:MAG TPA: hypothetical protein VGC10_08690 [Sphingomonas sp.]